MKLDEAVFFYTEGIQQTKLSLACCTHYASFARSLSKALTRELGRDATVADMTPQIVRRFLTVRCNAVRPGSAYQYHQMTGHFCRWLCEEGYTETDVTAKIARPKAEQKERHIPAPELVAAILDGARKIHPPYRAALATGVLAVMAQSGLRPGEVKRLRLDSYDRRRQVLKVYGTKGGKSRELPLSDSVVESLEAYLKARPKDCAHDFLFAWNKGFGIGYEGLRTLVRHVVKIAGIEEHFTPHTMRHVFASSLLRSGANIAIIMRLLGHSSLTATQVYLHSTEEELRDAVNRGSAQSVAPPSPGPRGTSVPNRTDRQRRRVSLRR